MGVYEEKRQKNKINQLQNFITFEFIILGNIKYSVKLIIFRVTLRLFYENIYLRFEW